MDADFHSHLTAAPFSSLRLGIASKLALLSLAASVVHAGETLRLPVRCASRKPKRLSKAHARQRTRPPHNMNPPALAGIENPSSATIVCQGDTFTFALDQALSDNGGIFLVIEATEGQSNGVTRAHGKAVQIHLEEEPDTDAINIRADYVAKHGAPSAAAPKIFFRYYFVNSSTGEKSGTMLAEVTWTAAAAGGEP